MISHVGTVSIFVSDQDRALDFYTNKMGFELRGDNPMGPPGAPRWIEVAPKGAQTRIVLYKPTQEMPGASTYERAVASIGTFAPFVLEVDDLVATHKELVARGVEFADPPAQQPWGWWATVKDPDGNLIGLHQ
jgi:predicted enzyme related to lactoylglutathione lyase